MLERKREEQDAERELNKKLATFKQRQLIIFTQRDSPPVMMGLLTQSPDLAKNGNGCIKSDVEMQACR